MACGVTGRLEGFHSGTIPNWCGRRAVAIGRITRECLLFCGNDRWRPPLRRQVRRALIARRRQKRRNTMLGWALTFLVVALIAAVLGFGGIAGAAVEIAKIIFFVAIVLFLIAAVVGVVRGRSPRL